jgi:hypothetical protein
MADLFSTDVLTRTVSYLPVPISFLLDRFFPFEQLETSEEIHFDVENGKRRIAPFVSPLVQGKIVEELGYTAKTFKPAYVKPKTVFDPTRPFKRAMGERIGGVLTPMQRIEMAVSNTLSDHVDMITRRQEVMASEALRLGRVTVKGELYPTVVVDFGRDAALTIVLSGGSRWNQAGVDVLANLEAWAALILDKSGATSIDVVMATDVWAIFRADAEVKEELNRFRGSSTLSTDALIVEGATFMGQIRTFNIWVYGGSYIDDDGATQKMIPDGTLIMGGPQIEGARAYGAIRDEKAGFQALPYFPKSWLEEDPAVRFLMTQSAPLVIPYRPNASLSATVL